MKHSTILVFLQISRNCFTEISEGFSIASGIASRNREKNEQFDIINAYQRKYRFNYVPQIDLFDVLLKPGMKIEIFGIVDPDSIGYKINKFDQQTFNFKLN